MPRKYRVPYFIMIALSLLAWLIALIVTEGNGRAAQVAGAIPLVAAVAILVRSLWERIARGKVNQ